MNVLIDTNVLLSAALRDRLPERVVMFVATQDDWKWLVTPAIRAEYADVLKRPKFALTSEVLQQWTNLIDSRTVSVASPPDIEYPRDPKDAPFLAAAIATTANYLVTGDKDLLDSQLALETKILAVGEFATLFQIS